jgi:hypothetical protein
MNEDQVKLIKALHTLRRIAGSDDLDPGRAIQLAKDVLADIDERPHTRKINMGSWEQ